MKKKLAIVIPAYKAEFLRDALDSIAKQTNKDFHLYIGDDNSPQDLYAIVKPFESRINLTYLKFDANFGGQSLIAQWRRCIDMTQNEEWIWLFSDDDVMAADCVESFFKGLNAHNNVDLFHFNIKVINQFGELIKTCNSFPDNMAVNDFFNQRVKHQINSTVVEYIFSRKIYEASGFVDFDLAWCSDDATWIQFGSKNGIQTLSDTVVYFRDSGINISSDLKDRNIVMRKLNASVAYMHWVRNFFSEHNTADLSTDFDKLKWISSTLFLSKSFSLSEKKTLILKVLQDLNYGRFVIPVQLYMYYLALKPMLGSKKKQVTVKPLPTTLVTIQ